MPFKSKKQIAKMGELEKQGKVKPGTVKQWAAETPNISALPEAAPKARKGPKTIQEIKEIRVKKYGK